VYIFGFASAYTRLVIFLVLCPKLYVIRNIFKSNVICISQALRLSRTALGETTAGQIVNLLSNDVNRFDAVVIFLNYLWIGPLQTVAVTCFLWREIGVSSVIGVAALLMAIPLQGPRENA